MSGLALALLALSLGSSPDCPGPAAVPTPEQTTLPNGVQVLWMPREAPITLLILLRPREEQLGPFPEPSGLVSLPLGSSLATLEGLGTRATLAEVPSSTTTFRLLPRLARLDGPATSSGREALLFAALREGAAAPSKRPVVLGIAGPLDDRLRAGFLEAARRLVRAPGPVGARVERRKEDLLIVDEPGAREIWIAVSSGEEHEPSPERYVAEQAIAQATGGKARAFRSSRWQEHPFTLVASAAPSRARAVLEQILASLDRVASSGLSADEVAAGARSARVEEALTLLDPWGRLSSAVYAAASGLEPREVLAGPDLIRCIPLNKIGPLAQKLAGDRSRRVVVIGDATKGLLESLARVKGVGAIALTNASALGLD